MAQGHRANTVAANKKYGTIFSHTDGGKGEGEGDGGGLTLIGCERPTQHCIFEPPEQNSFFVGIGTHMRESFAWHSCVWISIQPGHTPPVFAFTHSFSQASVVVGGGEGGGVAPVLSLPDGQHTMLLPPGHRPLTKLTEHVFLVLSQHCPSKLNENRFWHCDVVGARVVDLRSWYPLAQHLMFAAPGHFPVSTTLAHMRVFTSIHAPPSRWHTDADACVGVRVVVMIMLAGQHRTSGPAGQSPLA